MLQLPLKDRSSNLDENLSEFPYIEGDFILNNYSLPDFTEHSRTKLIDLANFDWSQISIDIFGAIFEQLARDNETNKDDSAYFTNEENIKRVLDPLCLNALRKDLDEIKKLPKKKQSKLLIELKKKVASVRFFDPASGIGDFLAVAYKNITDLEFVKYYKELIVLNSRNTFSLPHV